MGRGEILNEDNHLHLWPVFAILRPNEGQSGRRAARPAHPVPRGAVQTTESRFCARQIKAGGDKVGIAILRLPDLRFREQNLGREGWGERGGPCLQRMP